MITVKLLTSPHSETDANQQKTIPLVETIQLHPADASVAADDAPRVTAQYDTGADRSIVDERALHQLAHHYEPRGRLLNHQIYFADGTPGPEDPLLVEFKLRAKDGGCAPITAMVLPSLLPTSTFTAPVPGPWRHEAGAHINTGGPVDLLIGQDYAHLHPHRFTGPDSTINQLTKFRSTITGNMLISGAVQISELSKSDEKISRTLLECTLSDLDTNLKNQWASENAAAVAANGQKVSDFQKRVMEYENELNYNGLTFDKTLGKWNATYHYDTSLLEKLKPNYPRVSKRQKSWLKKLQKSPELRDCLKNQAEDYIARGFWAPLDNCDVTKDMQEHYLPFNYVHNDNSKSTPVRIVTDSSCKDDNGISLNSCQRGGTKFVGDSKATLILARAQQQIAVGDVSKFYHQFILSGTDQSLRRLLVPVNWSDPEAGFNTFVERMMPFGDAAAGPLAVLGRIKNCEVNLHLAPLNLQKSVELAFGPGSYVDDVVAGAPWEANIQDTIDATELVAKAGGLSFKEWTKVGDSEQVKILGYIWDAKSDTLSPRLAFNVGQKIRGKVVAPPITLDNIDEQFSKPLTKRRVLAIQGQFYDPLGLYLPLGVVFRHIYREICIDSKDKSFDETIPPTSQEKLKIAVLQAIKLRELGFPRSIVPKSDPSANFGNVVVVCDGSMMAHGVSIFWRPGKISEPSTPHLVCSVAKLAGLDGLTIYKNEMFAAERAVLEGNYIKSVLENVLEVEDIYFLSDSMAVLVSLNHVGGKFKPFSSNRVSYIRLHSNIKNWRHIPGKDNPADIITRDLGTVEDIQSAQWRHGGVLSQPLTSVTSTVGTSEIEFHKLPEALIKCSSKEMAKLKSERAVLIKRCQVKKGQISSAVKSSENPFIVLASLINCWGNLKTAAAGMLRLKHKIKKQKVTWSECLREADAKLLRLMAPDLPKDGAKVLNMRVLTQNGIKVVETRFVSAGRRRFLPLLMADHPFAKLIMRDYHNSMGHFLSVRKLADIIRHAYVIPGCQIYLRKLKDNCLTCSRLNPELLQPKMGPVPHARLLRTRPFAHVQADIFGPYLAHDVHKRATCKIWGLLILCQSTRAVNLVTLYDYSCDAVICALTRHVNEHGQFITWRSDSGTQLKAAGAAILQGINEHNTKMDPLDITHSIKTKFPMVEFDFGVPSAPWGQGAAEALIKLAKKSLRCLQRKVGERYLNTTQWATRLSEVKHMINNRPLVASPEPGGAVCANDILLGYSSQVPETSAFPPPARFPTAKERLFEFWQKFAGDPHLLSCGKWIGKDDQQELQIGDTVLILDRPSPLGSYSLGIVEDFKRGRDGISRRVGLRTAKTGGNELLWRHPRTVGKLMPAAN